MLCIWHDDCFDGLAAAWVVRRKYPNASFHASHYGAPPPAIANGEVVFIVDFSYPPETLIEICSKAERVHLLDHHQRAIDRITNYFDDPANPDQPANLYLTLDASRSGVGLTWKFFNPDEPMNWLVERIEDHDLHRRGIRGTEEVTAYLGALGLTFESIDRLLDTGLEAAIQTGKILLEKHRREVEWHIKYATDTQMFAGFMVPVCNAPHYLATDIGVALTTKGNPFAVIYYDEPGQRKFSLRGAKDCPVNLAALASMYGGDGHPKAAGFRLPLTSVYEHERKKRSQPIRKWFMAALLFAGTLAALATYFGKGI